MQKLTLCVRVYYTPVCELPPLLSNEPWKIKNIVCINVEFFGRGKVAFTRSTQHHDIPHLGFKHSRNDSLYPRASLSASLKQKARVSFWGRGWGVGGGGQKLAETPKCNGGGGIFFHSLTNLFASDERTVGLDRTSVSGLKKKRHVFLWHNSGKKLSSSRVFGREIYSLFMDERAWCSRVEHDIASSTKKPRFLLLII